MAGCSRLKAGRTCNLTRAFEDPFDQYKARVRGVVSNLTSPWTVSPWFQPLTDSEIKQSVCVWSRVSIPPICTLAPAILARLTLLWDGLSPQSRAGTSRRVRVRLWELFAAAAQHFQQLEAPEDGQLLPRAHRCGETVQGRRAGTTKGVGSPAVADGVRRDL